jgi:hypothetical protein
MRQVLLFSLLFIFLCCCDYYKIWLGVISITIKISEHHNLGSIHGKNIASQKVSSCYPMRFQQKNYFYCKLGSYGKFLCVMAWTGSSDGMDWVLLVPPLGLLGGTRDNPTLAVAVEPRQD